MKLSPKPANFFLFAALLFGLLMIVVTPPFQVPDEFNHFYRAYQVSEGQFSPTRTANRLGGELPKSLESFAQCFEILAGKPEEQTNYLEITEADKNLKPQNRQWYDFPNTAVYSFLNYFPQAIGIALGRLFSPSVAVAFYAGRLFTLLFWVIAIFTAIRLTPAFKWLFAMLALLPTSLYINTSLSADVVNNAICFLFLAYTLHLAFRKNQVRSLDLLLLFILTVLICLLKIVYAPLLLLLLLIPKSHFKSTRRYWGSVFLIGIAALISLSYSNYKVNQLYIPYAEYAPEAGWVHLAEGSDKNLQMDYVLSNGTHIFEVYGRSMINAFPMYAKGIIGSFGWLEFGLPVWIISLTYLLLLILPLGETGKINFARKARIVLLAAFLGMSFLLVLSQHLIWGIVGADQVANLQGRYFIPMLPVFFMLFYNRKIHLQKFPQWITPVFSSLLLIFSLILIYQRFFV